MRALCHRGRDCQSRAWSAARGSVTPQRRERLKPRRQRLAAHRGPHRQSDNLHRRHLSQSQKAMVADRIRDYYDEQAKERQKAPLKKGRQNPVPAKLPERQKSSGGDRKSPKKKTVPAKLPEPKNGDSRDQAGKVVGVSGKLVDAATTVLERGSKELVAKYRYALSVARKGQNSCRIASTYGTTSRSPCAPCSPSWPSTTDACFSD